MAIRSGFFYTRQVPCELWFLDKDKPEECRDKVLMIDARNVYRKVTRKINDFTPAQMKNLTAIVWLYRGQSDRFVALVAEYLECMFDAAREAVGPLNQFSETLAGVTTTHAGDGLPEHLTEIAEALRDAKATFEGDAIKFAAMVAEFSSTWKSHGRDNYSLIEIADQAEPLIESSRNLIRQANDLYKLLSPIADAAVTNRRRRSLKPLEEARDEAVKHLKVPRNFWTEARWLQERFPKAQLRDVEGLVKLVRHDELAANGWSLSPGRYVGVAPKEEDDDFDFIEVMRSIHEELNHLNGEALELAERVARNFEEMVL